MSNPWPVTIARPANTQPDSETTVFRMSDEDSAVRVPVKLGKASVDRIVILDGLAPGDRIIVSDMSQHLRADRLTVN